MDDMTKDIDFSKGERGKFFGADALRCRVLINPRQGDYAREREAIFAAATFDDCLALVKQAGVAESSAGSRRTRAKTGKKS